jgi:predicted helicase
MTGLSAILNAYRSVALSEREKGTYFEELERQCVKSDQSSGIVNDANDWAIETMNNPRYPLELLLRVITVSVETMKIVKALPRLELP